MKTLDRSVCKIEQCSFKDIRNIFETYHYKKGHMGGGISTCFKMICDGKLVGGAVLGKPRHEKKYKGHIDIRRMACLDSSLKNSESYFLGRIIRWLRDNTDYTEVLSYSDMTVGHEGTIYKASNFKNTGMTAPSKYVEWEGKIYHPRSLTIDRDYSYRMREDVKNGKAVVKTGLPKIIWVYTIKRRTYKDGVPIKSNIKIPQLFGIKEYERT